MSKFSTKYLLLIESCAFVIERKDTFHGLMYENDILCRVLASSIVLC